jgi:hypothetical protein
MVQSLTYYPGFAQFEQRLQIKPDAPLGQLRVAPLRAFVQYCNEENCFPINLEFAAPVEVIDGQATPTPTPNPVPPAKDPATPSGSASLPPELVESLRKLAAAAGQAHAKAEPATAKKASPRAGLRGRPATGSPSNCRSPTSNAPPPSAPPTSSASSSPPSSGA